MKRRIPVRMPVPAVVLALFACFVGVMQAFSLDCPSAKLVPGLRLDEIRAEGLVRVGRSREGTNRRDRLRGLLSRPAASATVVVSVGSVSRSICLDERGAFGIEFPRPTGTGPIHLAVADSADGTVLRSLEQPVPASASLLFVSDIDDTVLISDVFEKRKLLVNSLLRTITGRQAVAGTPEIYRELSNVGGNDGFFVYLSASPAALERFISRFLREWHFPEGLLVTGDGVSYTKEKTFAHKTAWLRRLAGLFPRASMVLIGDAGEQDPEIYSAFALSGSARISGVIIRRIGRFGGSREAAIRKRLAEADIPLLLWSEPDEFRAGLASLGFRIP